MQIDAYVREALHWSDQEDNREETWKIDSVKILAVEVLSLLMVASKAIFQSNLDMFLKGVE